MTLLAFDLGGVLVNVSKDRLHVELGVEPHDVERAFFGKRHDDLTVGHLSGEAYIALVAHELSRPASRVREAWARVVSLMPGAAALLDDVQVPFVFWSNTDPVHGEVLARALGRHFTSSTRHALSFAVGAMKPDPAYFQVALQHLDMPAGDVLFVDDRTDNVAAAKVVGVDAVRVVGLNETRALLGARGLLRVR